MIDVVIMTLVAGWFILMSTIGMLIGFWCICGSWNIFSMKVLVSEKVRSKLHRKDDDYATVIVYANFIAILALLLNFGSIMLVCFFILRDSGWLSDRALALFSLPLSDVQYIVLLSGILCLNSLIDSMASTRVIIFDKLIENSEK